MLKCSVVAICVCTLISIVFCAPGYEDLREKQSTWQDVTDQFKIEGSSRTRRQDWATVDIQYIDASALDLSKLHGLQSKESPPIAPINDVNSPSGNIPQQPRTNTEYVTENANYVIYKVNSVDNACDDKQECTGNKDTPPIVLPEDKMIKESTGSQSYIYGSEQYSGISDLRRQPPPPPPDNRYPLPRHNNPPPNDYPPPSHHHHPPPPPQRDYRPDYYDRPYFSYYDSYYDRRPSFPRPYEDRSRRFDEDRPTRQSGGPPPHRGPPPRDYGSPYRHGGPPPRYSDPYHRGPPRYGGPPPRYGGPPDRYDDRRSNRGPPPFDRRYPPPPYHRGPPPDRRPPYDRNHEHHQHNSHQTADHNDSTTSSTTDAGSEDDQYQLDIRIADDAPSQKTMEATNLKRDVTTNSPLALFLLQATPVTPEN